MSVVKPRNRLVFFRVSEDEFQKLADMCQSGDGARSISELARSAVHRLLADSAGDNSVSLKDLHQCIGVLHERLDQLTSLLADQGHAAAQEKVQVAAVGSNGNGRAE